MEAALTANLLQHLNPLRLAGPMFDKELRVASRRRRLYLLRFAYVVVLVLVVLQLWYSVPRSGKGGSGVVQISRLGEMGRQIVTMVVWFQFVTGQILAAVLLSDAIGSEIRQRTLDVLLVTPVRGVQIVIGKLASKLLQAVSLLTISLPMLAVVRIFGGVPWDFVMAGLCITLSAGVFAGSLSLWSSISSRHPYHAVLTVGLWYLVIWGLLPMVLTALSGAGYVSSSAVMSLLRLTNPLVALGGLTPGMVSNYTGMPGSTSWPWLCLILLTAAAVLLAWSVRRVRRIALRVAPVRVDEASGETPIRARKAWGRGAIRPVIGSPIVWKERCIPLFRMPRWGVSVVGLLVVALVLGIVVLSIVYQGTAFAVAFPLIQILQLIFVIDLVVGAAGAVTKEREARTWPILLTMPLEDGEIVKGKAVGVFRRNLPLLLPLLVLYPLVFLLGPFDAKTVPQLAGWAILLCCNLGSTAMLLLGVGLYFSARLKTTTAAVMATFAVYLAPKFLFCGFLSPLLTLSAGMMGVMTGRNGSSAILGMLLIGVAPAVVYVGIGLLFMRLAVRRVRRDIF